VKGPLRAALIAALLLTGAAAVLRSWGVGVWQLLASLLLAVLVASLGWYGTRLLSGLKDRIREHAWRDLEGQHHAFAGVPLRVHDDGRYVWLGGSGLLRVLGRQESDDVLAARMPGQWRRDEQGQLLLRVDAVIDYLAHMPGRDTHRVQKLRRYLERDVLFPARERHRRA
jgi:hypothetical protein